MTAGDALRRNHMWYLLDGIVNVTLSLAQSEDLQVPDSPECFCSPLSRCRVRILFEVLYTGFPSWPALRRSQLVKNILLQMDYCDIATWLLPTMSSFCLATSEVTVRLLKPTRPGKVIIESPLSLALASISVAHPINLARYTIWNKELYFGRNIHRLFWRCVHFCCLLVLPCDDKPGFNLCKTLNVYILTRQTTGCYETGHPVISPCFKIVVPWFPFVCLSFFLTLDERRNKQIA